VKPPRGRAEIVKLYGDPLTFVRADGSISPLWEARMTTVDLPEPLPLGWARDKHATRVRVNVAIASVVEATLNDLYCGPAWRHLKTYDGGYVFRPSRGSSRLSMHALGGALDFNAFENRLGMVDFKMHPDVVRVFRKYGWTWGGAWRRPDAMHYQFGTRF
jgi:hypothetical protein